MVWLLLVAVLLFITVMAILAVGLAIALYYIAFYGLILALLALVALSTGLSKVVGIEEGPLFFILAAITLALLIGYATIKNKQKEREEAERKAQEEAERQAREEQKRMERIRSLSQAGPIERWIRKMML